MAKHIVFIHGTWGNGPDTWSRMVPEMEKRGFMAHTPTLRHHDLPFVEGSVKISSLSLLDYVADLVEYVENLDSPPLLFGISMGGLLAQLVGARTANQGLALFGPAPAHGMFNAYPSMVRIFFHHFLQWGFWKKPLFPEWSTFRWGVANEQTEEQARNFFNSSCTESGRAYTEMAFWWLDKNRASLVNTAAVSGPVIVFGGGKDRVVVPRIARLTARRYPNGKYIHLPDSDHMMVMGSVLSATLKHVDAWLEENHL